MMKPKPDILTLNPDSTSRRDSLPGPMSIVVIDDFEILGEYVHAWEELAAEALEPNPFYEPWMLIPALRGLTSGNDLCVVLCLRVIDGEPLLCGVFPLEKQHRYKKLPVNAFSLWRHVYAPLCTPLIRKSSARECLDAFLDWLASQRECALMDFNLVSGDGPFNQLLQDCLNARGISSLDGQSHDRAILRPRESPDQYFRAAHSREHRKDLRRKGRRLAERGRLEFNSLGRNDDIDVWIEEFLQLEASGWKGNGGGAFACNQANRDYFVSIARAAFARDRLTMLALRLDGIPVAMKVNFITEPGSFAFKIAFDENYALYSPGVLLEIENINLFHAQQRIEWMDSCAIPEHPMIDRLWLDRRNIKSVLIPTGNKAGELVISALPLMRSLNRRIRQFQVRG